MKNGNVRRINGKKANQGKYRTNMIWWTVGIWAFLMINILLSEQTIGWMFALAAIFTIGAGVVLLVLVKPGRRSEAIHDYGFWRWLFSFGHPGGKGSNNSRRRKRQRRNYRR